jgi:hypothetical protein
MFDGTWGTTYVPRKTEVSPWVKWFAWYPVKVNGRRTWLKTVYRRCINTYVDYEDWKRYEYGNIFDVIRGDE